MKQCLGAAALKSTAALVAEKTASRCSPHLVVFCKQPGKMTSGACCQSESGEELGQEAVQILIAVTQSVQADHLHKFTLGV